MTMFNQLKDLKLSNKAVLATMIPFVINVVWLVAMWSNSLRIEHLADLEHRQSNLVEDVNIFIQSYYELQGAFITAFYTGANGRFKIYLGVLEEFHRLAQPLRQDPQLLDAQKAGVRELDEFADFQCKFLKDSVTDKLEDRWRQFAAHRRIFLSMFKSRFEDRSSFKDFILPQRTELDLLRQSQKTQQRIFIILLIAGVSSNLAIAVFVHYLFGRHVTQQVRGLVANARSLSKKQVMLEPLKGRDDFAVIDSALHQSQRELAEAVASRQALMQMIAHDLKSPLAASQVSLALILEREKETLNERGIKIINGVVSNNKRLLALISDLLTIDAFEAGHLDLTVRNASVVQCVDEAIDTLSGLTNIKVITVTKKLDITDGQFDYQRILQILVNLVSNAIKFSKKNSEIIIQSEDFSPTKLKIKVVDNGSGIADKDKPRIFEQYFQTEDGKRAQGTGLGLAVSKFIIQAHGEEIGFTSSLTGGTTFWFTLSKIK